MIALFTDFGVEGPYVGQVKAVLLGMAPGVPVVDLMADAPACDPRRAGYLLAALAPEMPAGAVLLCVVDPGVGTQRTPMVAEMDGRLLVGPDNGLFKPLSRRASVTRFWEITWRPQRLSASFHGRDLFAPVAARLASGMVPEAAGCRPYIPGARPDWPDDLAEIVYVDRFGNAMSGLRAAALAPRARLLAGGRELPRARTFGDVPAGEAFWYENSCGLAEVAVNGGSAARVLALDVGAPVTVA
jgi:S-adenosylmethionine hydrolase